MGSQKSSTIHSWRCSARSFMLSRALHLRVCRTFVTRCPARSMGRCVRNQRHMLQRPERHLILESVAHFLVTRFPLIHGHQQFKNCLTVSLVKIQIFFFCRASKQKNQGEGEETRGVLLDCFYCSKISTKQRVLDPSKQETSGTSRRPKQFCLPGQDEQISSEKPKSRNRQKEQRDDFNWMQPEPAFEYCLHQRWESQISLENIFI